MIEKKVYEYLIGRGFSREEASLEAFMVIEALRGGTIAPETAREAYGLDDEDIKKI